MLSSRPRIVQKQGKTARRLVRGVHPSVLPRSVRVSTCPVDSHAGVLGEVFESREPLKKGSKVAKRTIESNCLIIVNCTSKC